jgi:paraquat-inducible protein B
MFKSWYVWIFPLVAVAITGWLFYDYFSQKGPTIQISFDDASGIQAGKTRVRFRGVAVGIVKDVTISPDNKEAFIKVTMQKDVASFAVQGTQFWVVLPKVGFQGVSGLETLFEGSYIAVQPGPADAASKTDFKGHMSMESESVENTRTYFLDEMSGESIVVGDSVTFRGIKIGAVTKVSLFKTGQSVSVQINIHNRYEKLIRTNTVFWRKVGIQADLGLFSSQVKVNSLDSILHGGVELATPDGPGEVARAQTRFSLAHAPPKNSDKWSPNLEISEH